MENKGQVAEQLLKKEWQKITLLIKRSDWPALVNRAWHAESGTKAEQDFKKNPPINTKTGKPFSTAKAINKMASAAQCLQRIKRQGEFNDSDLNAIIGKIRELKKD